MSVLTIGLSLAADHAHGEIVLLGKTTAADQRTPVEQVDHSAWGALLKKHVDKNGRVNYAAWKASRQDSATLDVYLDRLSSASLAAGASQPARLAFWINAYNAVTVKGILREHPTSSIRNHTARFLGYNIWKHLKLQVENRPYSLDDIEHQVLRKMGDPRIHFAIVCASIGCPRLLAKAYTPERIDEQLDANARHFFADSAKFQYDASRRQVEVSPILKWFAEDFGGSQAEQIRRVAPYLPSTAAQQAASAGGLKVRYLEYDWGLNEQ